jgi:hypothetical protein
MNTDNNRSEIIKPQRSVVDLSRRSFAKAGAGMAPVIMLLSNRPAWAGNDMCSCSGYASYHAAGAIQSHSNNHPNHNWCKPTNPNNPKPGWCENTSWPSSYGRCSKNGTPSNCYSQHWTGAKTYAQVQTFESQNKMTCLVATMFPSLCAGNPDTLQDALGKCGFVFESSGFADASVFIVV